MEVIPENKIREIFSDLFVFFGTLSPAGLVIDLAGSVFERLNTDPKILAGQNFAETVFWQTSESNAAILLEAVGKARQGRGSDVFLDFRISASEKIGVEFRIYPIVDESAGLTVIFFCATEHTARDNEVEFYKEKSERLLYAAENAETGLWYWDLVSDTIHSTPKCNEFFEVPADGTMTYETFLEKLHPEDRPAVEKALIDSQRFGREYQAEYRVIQSNGEIQWISARGQTYHDSGGIPREMMGVVQMITKKKLASEKLSKVYARDRRARDRAEEASSAKDSFLAVVSHELRSPLNAILGWTKILLEKDLDDETRTKALETIEKSARSQAKLLDDLLDSSRVASGRLKLEYCETDLSEIIKTVYNLQKPAADAKNIELKLAGADEPIKVFGDMIRLQQVISNLLSNSLKFTPVGGKITIQATFDPANAFVRVIDNGQGISAKSLPAIFRQFRQGDEASAGRFGGLGLGLSIAKILVEKHKGMIRAESEGRGKGSVFTVTLPLLTKAAGKSEIPPKIDLRAEKALKNINILIVEDETDSREVLDLFLQQCGAVVQSFDSAEKALEYLQSVPKTGPDVILSDLAMPGRDGCSFLEAVRAWHEAAGGSIPALALSGSAPSESKEKALKSGFQKYHTKPFRPEALIRDILELVGKS